MFVYIVMKPSIQEHTMTNLFVYLAITLSSTNTKFGIILVEFELDKTLNIYPQFSFVQREKMICLLQNKRDTFAWDYINMKGIHHDIFTHHIYSQQYI